jgi:hypothetical protein
MPARLVSNIPVGSVPPMGMLQCLRQPISRARNGNQMDMIGHEAIANQRDFVEGKVFPQQLEVDRTVSIAIQYESSPISTLRQMVWNICGYNPSQSSHSVNTISANGLACFLADLMGIVRVYKHKHDLIIRSTSL